MLNHDDEPYRLFDVKKDPQEMEDLSGHNEHKDFIAELKGNLLDRRAQTQEG